MSKTTWCTGEWFCVVDTLMYAALFVSRLTNERVLSDLVSFKALPVSHVLRVFISTFGKFHIGKGSTMHIKLKHVVECLLVSD